ncbi:unnamed protein product, partial [marine sediment metagenome]
ESENVNDMRAAELSMDAETRGGNDALNYELVGLPLPILHKEYQISIRKLYASRNMGESLDTTQARLAALKIAELQEELLFNGYSSFEFGSYILYGYTDYPPRNSVTLTAAWDAAGKTAAQILTDVFNCKAALLADKKYGPYELYIPSAYEIVMDNDYNTSGSDTATIRERILKVGQIQGLKVADVLSANNVIMSQMTIDNVRIVQGMPLTNVEWQSNAETIFHFRVMTITIPQLRTDQDGNSGIAHLAA